MNPSVEKALLTGIAELGMSLDDKQIRQLLYYIDLLQQWNKAYNLTAVKDPIEMVYRHLLDSLAIQPFLQGNRFIDVGSGPGLPGIPLAIAMQDKKFTLLDSNGKKVRFLFQVRTALGLKNVCEIQARAESNHPQAGYDGVISRAFTSLTDMVEKTRHLLNDQGVFYAMKGRYPEKELSLMAKNYTVLSCHKLNIPGVDGERHLLKIGMTP